MEKNELITLLDNLSFKPGWRFSARPVGQVESLEDTLAWLSGEDVMFRIESDTVDTDENYAREGYPQKRELGWNFPLRSGDHDKEELLRRVFDLLMEIETHEAREFFRLKSEDWRAPFHPHRAEGNALYSRTGDVG